MKSGAPARAYSTAQMAALCIALSLFPVFSSAAVHPENPTAAIRPEKAAEAPPKQMATCAKQMMIILYGADEAGNMHAVALIRAPMELC